MKWLYIALERICGYLDRGMPRKTRWQPEDGHGIARHIAFFNRPKIYMPNGN